MIASYPEIFLATCFLILPVLYRSSHVFRYYLKYTCYIGFCMANSLYCLPFFCLRPKNVDNLLVGAYICKNITSVIGLKWILRNTEYLSEDKSYIIVSNHQSILDVLGMFVLWPTMRRCTAIAKKAIFYVWPFGLAAWLAGLIFIPRAQTEKSRQIMSEAGDRIKKEKIKLWVFSEGKRYSDGHIHPFKKGAFHIAIKAQLPILPVVFSQYYFLDHKNKRFDSGTVIVTVLPPISTEGKTMDDLESLLEETRNKMSTTFYEVNKECKNLKNSNIS
ncbi:hypothetical protein WA026_005921 [Henosepilachna vigintioctopunctata]|uniref:1-acyl-sn-glycerol-3-phosphate acyltransferase n=1 Tax=Henosepilachna vigintioctopunctata TaxID=420089 RepID=A0AAW1U2D8_9CUCU